MKKSWKTGISPCMSFLLFVQWRSRDIGIVTNGVSKNQIDVDTQKDEGTSVLIDIIA